MVEGAMDTTQQQRRKRWAAAILQTQLSPINKVRKLVALGYDEDQAELMVNGAQQGQGQMVYYEQLPEPVYDERETS
jgi:Holliday junction resolvasome RuvABC DNA-binding subunit